MISENLTTHQHENSSRHSLRKREIPSDPIKMEGWVADGSRLHHEDSTNHVELLASSLLRAIASFVIEKGLTEIQYHDLYDYAFCNMRQEDIALKRGVSQQAVSDGLKRSLAKMGLH